MTGEDFMNDEINKFRLTLTRTHRDMDRNNDILTRRVLKQGRREPARVVAADYGISKERVWQIEKRLLYELKAYLGFDLSFHERHSSQGGLS